MHRPGDPKQTAISDLSKGILSLVAQRFENSTLLVRAGKHNHSAIAAPRLRDVIARHARKLTRRI
jgi:hypothetical protein